MKKKAEKPDVLGLPDWNVFRQLYERPDDIVVCFDLLGTRNRISRLKSRKELVGLARQLEDIAEQALFETRNLSKRTMHASSALRGPVEKSLDFSPAVSLRLFQDTVVIIFNIHKAIKEGIFGIDVGLGTWLLFIFHTSQNVLDMLLARGLLARGAIGCGTIVVEDNTILGTAFLDAYDFVEGTAREPILGVRVSPSVLRYQNWINSVVPHVHCSVETFLQNLICLSTPSGIFVDPGVRNPDIYQLRLELLQLLRCNDRFITATANFYRESLSAWDIQSSEQERVHAFRLDCWLQHEKYVCHAVGRDAESEARDRFESWRKANTRCGIGLMKENEQAFEDLQASDYIRFGKMNQDVGEGRVDHLKQGSLVSAEARVGDSKSGRKPRAKRPSRPQKPARREGRGK